MGDIGFVGSVGWYDYSFADPRLDLDEDAYWAGRHGDEIWWDKKMTYWVPGANARGNTARARMRNPEVCAEMDARLHDHLSSIEGDVDQIITVIHTMPFLAGLLRSEPPYYRDAFTGGARLGETLEDHSKVKHCIGGHKHLSGDWKVRGIKIHRRVIGRIEDAEDIENIAANAVGVLEL